MRKKILLTLILIAFPLIKASSQVDPTLEASILYWTNNYKKVAESQKEAMLLISSSHIWTEEEVSATATWQKDFNEYLDSFRSIAAYAAEIYGFYYEVGKLTDNVGEFSSQLKRSPDNAIAVALTPKKNSIYQELILDAVDIVNDVREVCLSDIKMTEKERLEVAFGIRGKLKTMNRHLERLILAIKYTSLSDVWREVSGKHKDSSLNIKEIALNAHTSWLNKAKNVNVSK